MARTLIVSDRHNSFFTANNIRVGNQLPTEGNYVKGDIIVNIGDSTATEAMWICVESGNPGIWEVVGAGAGGGSNFVSVNNTVFVNGPVNEVDMGIGFGVTSKDKLIVHHNSVHLMQGVDYRIEGNKIVKLTEGNWNEDSEEAMFAFELFKNVESVDGNLVELKTKLVCMQNTVTVNGAVNEVKIGIEGFNKDKDTLMVFENETFLTRGVNYEINGNGDGIVPVGDEVWNDVMIDDWSYTFVVFKDVPLVEGEDKIGMDLLADDVKKAIQDASNIDLSGYAEKGEIPVNVSELVNDAGYLTEHQDLSGYATKEEMNDKVAQDEYDSKIAELEGRVNEAFTNANNGKQLIASAIGEPVSSEDTFQAMSNDINGLLSTFKTNMMNNGIAVESGDRFKSLIDKIATMVEEGSGKGMRYVQGSYTYTSENSVSVTVQTNLGFTPQYFVVVVNGMYVGGVNDLFASGNKYMVLTTDCPYHGYQMLWTDGGVSSDQVFNLAYDANSFTISGGYKKYVHFQNGVTFNWHAFGIVEEDTTLRDSLASILQEEGVSITEEDDMASLITKVDEEFDRQNNEMSGLEDSVNTLTNEKNDLEEDAENTRSTLAGLMQEGGYDITGNESIDSLLDLLVLSGISVSDIKQIASGNAHTFILKNDGSVWSCGHNEYGQLGLGTSDYNAHSTFAKVTTNINNDVKQIACNGVHTFILKNDGSVWSCGYNNNGQLGLGDTINRNTFTQVTNNINNDVKQVVCGNIHTFIIKNDGSVWSCGRNDVGQLGLGTSGTDRTTFTQVTTNINNDVKQIACGNSHTFILKNDGSIWSCGYNADGQLGLGGTANKTTFTQVNTNINNDVKQIVCGDSHTFILKNDGSIYSCGWNGNGELGLGDTTPRTTFTQVTTNINNDVKQIACSHDHAFIIKNDGSVWVCGWNGYGELGLGNNTNKTTFTQVTTNINNDVKQIVCGNEYTFILKNDGSVWSCGVNTYGQLGLNDTTQRNTFTNVPRGF